MDLSKKVVSMSHRDRQWDARFNMPNEEYVEQFKKACAEFVSKVNHRYFLVSGPEIGDQKYRDDYNVRHVHVAIITENPISKQSILSKLQIVQGYGYYLVPRNRDYPYSGWREHHLKERTKIDKTDLKWMESGIIPQDVSSGPLYQKRSEMEKKLTNREVLLELNKLIESGKEEEAFEKYPRNYLLYGEKLKSRLTQKRNFEFTKTTNDPHMWVHGYPGSGKTSLLAWLYPNSYKKNLDSKYFDLFDPKVHTHTILEDLDPTAVTRLGSTFLKTICDKQGFAIDQKYKTPQLATTCVLVSSNYSISECFVYEEKGREKTISAMQRRFYEVRIDNLLRFLGLKLISKYDRNQLLSANNKDLSKLFIDWDYVADCPTGYDTFAPEYYQKKIAMHYYGQDSPERPTKKIKSNIRITDKELAETLSDFSKSVEEEKQNGTSN